MTNPPEDGKGKGPIASTIIAHSDSKAKKVVPVRYWERWLMAAVVLVGVAMAINALVTEKGFHFGVVGQYFFSSTILSGVVLTIELTLGSMAIGIVLGIILAVLRMSKNPILAGVSSAYIWFFRGTPLLVQIIFWYNLAALLPRIGIGIPFGPQFVSGSVNTLIAPITAALLGLGLNEGAYMSEIVRAGMLSVGNGQVEAAQSLGMTQSQTFRKIVLPQAMRVIVPPTGNQVIGMLKGTSLVSVIAIAELLYSAQIIYSNNYQTIPLLIVASLWYLVMTTVLSVGQHFLERKYGRGYRSSRSKGRQRASKIATDEPEGLANA
jgi:polar amino acid transport system permease protein